jgi:hypothetical protein
MLKDLNWAPTIRRILGGGKMRLKTIHENLLTIPLSIKLIYAVTVIII